MMKMFLAVLVAAVICVSTIHSFRSNSYLNVSLSRRLLSVGHPESIPRNATIGSNINRTRLLCLILTSDQNHEKMIAVNSTWAKRCDKHYFVYGMKHATTNSNHELIAPVPDDRSHLTAKVRYAFDYALTFNNGTFDWIMKADDDTYVIMENLKHLLSLADPEQPGYLGFHMKTSKTKRYGYMSGGAGYVISSSALHLLVNIGLQSDSCKRDGGNEDEEIGICLAKSGVSVLNSLDTDGMETFHAVHIKNHLSPEHKSESAWQKTYSWNRTPMDKICCGRYPISIHHVPSSDQYVFEQLLYKTRIVGANKGGNSSTASKDDNHDVPIYNPFKVVKPFYVPK